ncbi:MAG: dehydrogenase [Planctomycetaceae bacterium]|nr:dehydrogenase [Planctomycetaceae bacterium]
MKTNWQLHIFVTVLLTTIGSSARAADDAFTPPPINVPDGYVVELAAAPPLVKHPMMAGFDDRGRLFIAESAGKNLRREDLEKELPNFVRMIEDTDGDGVFDKSTIFADKLTYPMGALWHDGWLYVASSGAIWRFKDTDDDGVADVREQLVNEFGYSGNAADVHGCFLGPCGRIYWCEGRHGHEFQDDGGHILSKGKAARIFSCRPNGNDVQVHCGGGMDNPVEIDFTEQGEMLGTVNILYRQRGDCLVHWMHGGVYPRHDQPQVTAEFKSTGDLLPPVLNLGHVAVSGTTRYRSKYLGDDFQDSFFITEFNTHKIVRTKLTRSGSTFAATAEEFLSSSSGDFHPTDVLEDADGSLLVIDTGGWFRIGCPTSQIAKPNILGAIYRIRRKDAVAAKDPRGQAIDWQNEPSAKLTAILNDGRPAVRDRAIRELAKRGPKSVSALEEAASSNTRDVLTRRNGVWALSRIGTPRALAAIRKRLADEDGSVRQAAAHSLGANRDRESTSSLLPLLNDADLAVRRETATALGKMGQPSAIPALLNSVGEENLDRVQQHALVYAMIDINDRTVTAKGLASENARIQRAALIALDQMDDGVLSRAEVTSLLDTNDLELQRVAIDIIARHSEWSEEVVGIVKPMLASGKVTAEQLDSVETLLIAFAENEAVQELIAESLAGANVSVSIRRTLLEVMRDCNLPSLPSTWRQAVAGLLTSESSVLLEQAISVAERTRSAEFLQPLQHIGANEKQSAELRVRALAASGVGLELSDSTYTFLSSQLNTDGSITRRLGAADAIGSSKLTKKQLTSATQLVASAGPLELVSLLGAFEANTDADVGRELVAALEKAPGLTNLSPGVFDRVFRSYTDEVQESAASLRKKLSTSNAEQTERLAVMQSKMDGGDPLRGHAVFLSQRTSCVTCHQVQGKGGRVGPDLTTTGDRRNMRDLLEALLYPSSSLARGFESFSIITTDGKVQTGLILTETADAIQLRTTDHKTITIRCENIEELLPSTVSIMPAGLDRTMSDNDLRDLIAYLQTLKAG